MGAEQLPDLKEPRKNQASCAVAVLAGAGSHCGVPASTDFDS